MSNMKDLDFNISDPNAKINFQIIRDELIARPKMTTGSGAPSGGSSGDLHTDTTNNRLYVNVAGTWKYTALT